MWPYKACLRPRRPVHGLRRLAMNWVESFNLPPWVFSAATITTHRRKGSNLFLVTESRVLLEAAVSGKYLGQSETRELTLTQYSLYNNRLEHFYGGEGNNSTPWQEPSRDTSAPRERLLPLTARSFVVSWYTSVQNRKSISFYFK